MILDEIVEKRKINIAKQKQIKSLRIVLVKIFTYKKSSTRVHF